MITGTALRRLAHLGFTCGALAVAGCSGSPSSSVALPTPTPTTIPGLSTTVTLSSSAQTVKLSAPANYAVSAAIPPVAGSKAQLTFMTSTSLPNNVSLSAVARRTSSRDHALSTTYANTVLFVIELEATQSVTLDYALGFNVVFPAGTLSSTGRYYVAETIGTLASSTTWETVGGPLVPSANTTTLGPGSIPSGTTITPGSPIFLIFYQNNSGSPFPTPTPSPSLSPSPSPSPSPSASPSPSPSPSPSASGSSGLTSTPYILIGNSQSGVTVVAPGSSATRTIASGLLIGVDANENFYTDTLGTTSTLTRWAFSASGAPSVSATFADVSVGGYFLVGPNGAVGQLGSGAASAVWPASSSGATPTLLTTAALGSTNSNASMQVFGFDSSGNAYTNGFADGAFNGTDVVSQYSAVSATAYSTTPTSSRDITITSANTEGFAVDLSGDVYTITRGNSGSSISEYPANSTSVSRTISSGLFAPAAMRFDAAGDAFVLNYLPGASSTIVKFPPSATTPSLTIANSGAQAFTVDSDGTVYALNGTSVTGAYTVTVYAPGSSTASRTITGITTNDTVIGLIHS